MKKDSQDNGKIKIQDYFAARRKSRKKQERKDWFRTHAFDILNLIVAIIALLISLLSIFLP